MDQVAELSREVSLLLCLVIDQRQVFGNLNVPIQVPGVWVLGRGGVNSCERTLDLRSLLPIDGPVQESFCCSAR